jgi:hypothetical protein
MLMCLIALIIGYLLSRHMGINGFTIGCDSNCPELTPECGKFKLDPDPTICDKYYQITSGAAWGPGEPDRYQRCANQSATSGATVCQPKDAWFVPCPVSPPAKKYSCSGTKCIEDENGDYDNDDCDNKCSPPAKNYSCSGTKCIEDEGGEYDTDKCDNKCKPVTKYSCSGTKCIEDENGKYEDDDCNDECSPPAKKYSCSGTKCIVKLNGKYNTNKCDNKCKEWYELYWWVFLIIGIVVIFIIGIIIWAATRKKS